MSRRSKNKGPGNKDEREQKKAALAKGKEIALKRAERQKRFLECYEKTGNGNLTQACKAAGIGTAAVYKWLRLFPGFTKRMMLIDESFLDEVQGALMDRATGKRMVGDREAQIYVMRTKGRHRGFGEHQTIEADITQRIPQDRIDALVKAYERTMTGVKEIPVSVTSHLEQAIAGQKRLSETIDVEAS